MKKLLCAALVLLLAFSLCGCRLVDKLLETDAVVVITPSDPHAVSDYGDGMAYFWQTFRIFTGDRSMTLAFDSLKDVSDMQFKVRDWSSAEQAFSLTLESLLPEAAEDEDEEEVNPLGDLQCRIRITYDSTVTYSGFSAASRWPEETAEVLTNGGAWQMLRVGNRLAAVEKLDNGNALLFELSGFSTNADGTEKERDPFETDDARAEITKMLRVLLNTVSVPYTALTEEQVTEMMPTSLCFWTESLAMQFPCSVLTAVQENAADWYVQDETGKKTVYHLEKADPNAAAEAVGSDLNLLAYALSRLEASNDNGVDATLSEAYGGVVIPYGSQYLLADETQKSVYLLTVS